jgi:hypothetical protein
VQEVLTVGLPRTPRVLRIASQARFGWRFLALGFMCAFMFISAGLAQQKLPLPTIRPQVDRGPISTQSDASTLDAPHRHDRNSKYDNPNQRDQITEDSWPSYMELPFTHIHKDPLPVGKSDAIVIGTITRAHSFLSNDKKDIYSEFQLLVKSVLKSEGDANISVGSTIDIERYGGQIRLPSGKTVVRGRADEPMPVPGGQYVVFVRYSQIGDDFSIVTAYRIVGTRVYWLDGPTDPKHPKFLPQAKDKNETQFLNNLRALISSSTGGPQ